MGDGFSRGPVMAADWRTDVIKDAARRIAELEALAQKLLAYCDAAMHQDQQYADERGELIAIAQGNR